MVSAMQTAPCADCASPTRRCRASTRCHASSPSTTSTAASAAGRNSSATTSTRSTRCCPATRSTPSRCCRRSRPGTSAATARSTARYALKVATRPRAGARNVAIKRLTFRKRGPIRLEFYFTFKPEANELRLLETDVRSIGFLYDLQTGDTDAGDAWRVMPHMRFLNAHDGEHSAEVAVQEDHHRVQAARHREQDGDARPPRAHRLARLARRRRRSFATTRFPRR